MRFQLARKLLAVLAFLVAAFLLYGGIVDIYFAQDPISYKQEFNDTGNLMLVLFISALPALGSYILWPK